MISTHSIRSWIPIAAVSLLLLALVLVAGYGLIGFILLALLLVMGGGALLYWLGGEPPE